MNYFLRVFIVILISTWGASANAQSGIVVSLEGVTGAGKTTLLKLLREQLELPMQAVEEPFAQWKAAGKDGNHDLFQHVMTDGPRWAGLFQAYVGFTHFEAYAKARAANPNCVVVLDRSPHSQVCIFHPVRRLGDNALALKRTYNGPNCFFDFFHPKYG